MTSSSSRDGCTRPSLHPRCARAVARPQQPQPPPPLLLLLLPLSLLLALAPAPVGGGRVFAVGSNGCGQLGDGSKTDAVVPKEITQAYDPELGARFNLTNVVRQVAASSGDDPSGETGYTLYLTHDGRVLASGYNDFFQLIDEQSVPSTREPVIVTSLSAHHIVQIAAGRTHSLFLDSQGVAYAVGFNSFGQLGLPESSNYNRQPRVVPYSGKLAQVAANQAGSHSLLRTAEGRVLVTGLNEHGQLGTNTLTNVNTPTPMLSPTGEVFSNDTFITMVAAGKTFSLLLDSGGRVFSVGGNDRGQLGLGMSLLNQVQKLPVLIDQWPATRGRIVHVAAGAAHSLFCDSAGRIFAVGDNSAGQLGTPVEPTQRGTPVELVKRWNSPGFEDGASCDSSGPRDERSCVRHVTAGARSSFFRTESGKVFASGGNEMHQLGGTWPDTFQIVPMELHDVSLPVAQLSSAGSHTVFLSAECSNTDGGPCSTAGTEECINVQTEATAPAFSYGCRCRAGWANGICAENFIPEYADQCNVTLEGRCEVDVDECASSPCQHGECDDTVSCAAKLANDESTTQCEDGDEECERAQEEQQKEREADNCDFELEPNEFMCTCEDNGLLGGYTSSDINREPVAEEKDSDIPTEMIPGLVCDQEVGPNIFFFSMMAVLSLVVLSLLAFGAVVTNMKMQDKKTRVHP
jgi:alpha-tubulin suppressor-like RCC1 family protein